MLTKTPTPIEKFPQRTLVDTDRQGLKTDLLRYRMESLMTTESEAATNYLAGADIASGLPMEAITDIVNEAHWMLPFDIFVAKYPIYANACQIYDIVQILTANCPIQEDTVVDVEYSQVEHIDAEDIAGDTSSETEDGEDNDCVFVTGEYANAIIVYSSDESQSSESF